MTTGEKLQQLRKEAHTTQEDLAEALGVTRQTISKWESDGAFPETDKLITLAKLYHVTVDFLLMDDHQPRSVPCEAKAAEEWKFEKGRLGLFLTTIGLYLSALILFSFFWLEDGYYGMTFYQLASNGLALAIVSLLLLAIGIAVNFCYLFLPVRGVFHWIVKGVNSTFVLFALIAPFNGGPLNPIVYLVSFVIFLTLIICQWSVRKLRITA